MSDETFYGVLLVVGVGLAAWGLIRRPWERKLREWAGQYGFRLFEFRGATAWEGPDAWSRNSDFHEVFRVTVEDGEGRQRSGWVSFRNRWGLWNYEFSDAVWDDPPQPRREAVS